jgi:ABC-type sugar transport system ATPase subunit/ribose/xylose/arabinose/galactoside ABC-type transport system permease subunit
VNSSDPNVPTGVLSAADATPRSSPPALLRARGIGKRFAGVVVLDDVGFDVHPGEVHTLMGENGAGKSTLMNLLAGVHRPDAGTLELDGRPLTLASPAAALRQGIALIHQEPLSFPDLTVAENLFAGRGFPRGVAGQIDWRSMSRRTSELLGSLGVSLSPTRRMSGLSIADQQMVELAAALSQNARVLLMDEPTAALTPREVHELFRIIRRLREGGVAIVFISHRLPEVFEISDRITVLRDGRCIGTRCVADTTQDEIIRMMVGRPLGELYDKPAATIGATLLKVDRLSLAGQFADVSFEVRAGEIVGLAGLVGAGRTEVAQAIFGARRADAGAVSIAGEVVRLRDPRAAIAHGIAYVPEDRARDGLLLPMSITHNATLASLRDVSSLGFLRPAQERAVADAWRGRLQTRLRDLAQPVGELSGGNQQKVVLGKWLQTRPRILLVDEPTRGIDVGAKAEVHHLLAELARQGCAILMISSDLPEVLAMSDRVLVMREGRLTGELSRDEATQERVMQLAAGTGRDAAASPLAARPAAASAGEAPADARTARRPRFDATRFREIGILAFVLLAFVGVGIAEPAFWKPDNLRTIALYTPILAIVALGQLMVIVSRNIDLSVGSTLGLAAIITGGVFAQFPGTPIWVAALLATTVGGLLGAVNGTLVAYLRVPAIIATLGTLTAYRGLIYIWSGGRQVDPHQLPPELIRLSQDGPLGVPWIIVFALVAAALVGLFLNYTATGRGIYAVGSNPRAALLRGIAVKRVLLVVFTLTGALAGFAALLFGARFGTINPNSVGVQLELETISTVVIGGAAVNGGTGTVVGTLLGCLLLAIIRVALPMLQITEFWQLAIYGLAILVAATLDGVLRRRREATA